MNIDIKNRIKDLKLLHIVVYYPPFLGGISDVCYNIVETMKDKCEQKVLCFNHEGNKHIEEKIDGIDVIRAKVLCRIKSQDFSPDFNRELKKQIREYKPDVIHLHLPNPAFCYYLKNKIPEDVKLIIHWHSDILGKGILYNLVKPYETWALKRADRIIVTSPQYLEYSSPLAPFKNKAMILPNFISEDKIMLGSSVLEKASEIKLKFKNKPIILFVGRHVVYKGLTYLIEADNYIKSDCVILIAGNGYITDKIHKQAEDHERIQFIGFIPDEDLSAYLTASYIFAFPSITKQEAFGVALAEGMYCGAVPITFTIPDSGVNWVNIKDETGLEVPCKDSIAYAKAVDKLLSDKKLHDRLATNAIARVKENFTLKKAKENIENIYLFD